MSKNNYPVAISEIMTKDILFVEEQETLGQAASKMNKRNIGSALVKNDDKVVGILTERDFLRSFGRDDKDVSNKPVSDFMTRNIKFISPSSSVEEAENIMNTGSFRHLPVMQDDQIVGLVSSKDIFKVFHHQEMIKRKQLEAVKNMVVTCAHELNNPLAIVDGCLGILAKGFDQSKVSMMSKSIARMVEIMKKISSLENLEEVSYSGDTKMYSLKKSD